MTDPDNFLSRWSRRKQEAAKQAPLPAQTDDVLQKPAQAGEDVRESPATSSDVQPAEPAFDLSKLPSLDSIGPQTDVSVFMQPGVPTSLSHAALRRAWAADPAIRDFVGLAENAWDFTVPDSIPGFGPLLPVDNVAEMMARHFGDQAAELIDSDEAKAASADVDEMPSQTEETNSAQLQQADKAPQHVANNDDRSEFNVDTTHRETESLQRNIDIAMQKPPTTEEAAPVPIRRRHGGALPT
jgi:hypothetical protein